MEKSHARVVASVLPTPQQMKEFWAQVASGRICKKNLQEFLRGDRLISGNDIISPNEIARAYDFSYSGEQWRQLAERFPAEEELRWYRAHDYALVACPPEPMSPSEILLLNPEIFLWRRAGGHLFDIKLVQKETTSFGWLAIRKDVVPATLGHRWENQLIFLTSEERVPNLGELMWFIAVYYKIRRRRLFENIFVRTSSTTRSPDMLEGSHFMVDSSSGSKQDGFIIGVLTDGTYSRSIGIAPARKQNSEL